MAERIFGVETEYALSVFGRRGRRVEPGAGAAALAEHLQRRAPHLPGKFSGGVFLQTGGRFYIDSGGHPELTTPEVLNPWDVCRYLAAGDRLLAETAEEIAHREPGIADIVLTRCNVCYNPARPTTWGCHESYAHQGNPDEFPEELIPHLVSRIIYTGAGGFDNRSAGIVFAVSPRAAHLKRTLSESSTYQRGIFHSKNETLAREGYHRLHVLAGESLCSQTAAWLRSGVTALVVAMIEAGLRPCRDIRLASPVDVLHRFSRDPTGAARAGTLAGGYPTALEMQRHILAKLDAHARHPVMPAWAPQVRRKLAEVLDMIEAGPAAAARTLDWAIKLALYQEHARRRGFTWDALTAWNDVLSRLDAALRSKCPGDELMPALNSSFLQSGGLLADEAVALTPDLAARGLAWEQLDAVLKIRAALFEMDTRFAQIGPKGIFNVLDRAGALRHAVDGVDNIEHAMRNPPAAGRARVRGRCIERYFDRPGHYACDWTGVWDDGQRRFVDLSDPFSEEEQWRDAPPSSRPRPPVSEILRGMVAEAARLYHQGRYEAARRLLQNVHPLEDTLDATTRLEMQRIQAWVHSRLGLADGVEILASLLTRYPFAFWLITDYVSAYRFRGLVSHPQIETWIERGEAYLRDHPQEGRERVAAFREHQGYHLMCEGRLDEARAVLDESRRIFEQSPRDRRIWCRATATLGEVHRRLGQRPLARRLLEEVAEVQRAEQYRGDLADFTLASLAKLSDRHDAALETLRQAKEVQEELGNHVGLTRTLLLEARLLADPLAARSLRKPIMTFRRLLPALGGCRLLAGLLKHWDRWIGGQPDPRGETDDWFWNV